MTSDVRPLMTLNSGKAGMSGLDLDKINKIIDDASKGSKFYEAKARNQARIDAQVEEMVSKLNNFDPAIVEAATAEADAIIARIRERKTDKWSRVIVHVDMDAFFAAVEERDNPELKTKPMAVGSMGMLSTSNYLARRFGVRAAMPGFIGMKLCPQLVIVPPDYSKYQSTSQIIQQVFAEFDAHFCAVSLDEAYLDITDYLARTQQSADQVVQLIRQAIFDRTSLTASAGIAPNTFLAKVCSDQNKPNGQFSLQPDGVESFVQKLPIRKVSGIGHVMEQILKRVLHVDTCVDLLRQRALIKLLFSESTASFFFNVALGLGHTDVSAMASRSRKSLSTEATFKASSDEAFLLQMLDSLCLDLARDLAQNDLKGCQLTLKIKTDHFVTKTKAAKLLEASSDEQVIQSTARKLLKGFMESQPLTLRLIGVRMCHFKQSDCTKQSTLSALVARNTGPLHRQFTCPSCELQVPAASEQAFNSHLDQCLAAKKAPSIIVCPVCEQHLSPDTCSTPAGINAHIDECLTMYSLQQQNLIVRKRKSADPEPTAGSINKKKNLTIMSYFTPR